MLYKDIISGYNEIQNINYSLSLLNWDQSVNIPKNGHQGRSSIIETLTKKSYEALTDDFFYEKILKISEAGEFNRLTAFQQNEIKKIGRNVLRTKKIPKRLVAELAKTTSFAMNKWAFAKEKNDDKDFLPLLEKIFELKKEEAGYAGFEKNPYNALLDNFEFGLTYEYIEKIFGPLKAELSTIIKKIRAKNKKVSDDFLFGMYDKKKQWDFGLMILNDMGLEPDYYRQDASLHPFTAKTGYNDIRITTNIYEKDFKKGFFSTIHEGGHCLFEINVCKNLKESIFAELDILALHESQSRFYENIIGRSSAFWENYFPVLKEIFNDSLKGVSKEEFYQAVNKVENNPIRIESDELTYNLHIILRTELEESIFNGKIDVRNINEAWNEKTFELFGFYPKNKSEGYLQDIHWSDGLMGYFPTYALGNIAAAEIYFFMQKEIGEIKKIDKEAFLRILKWFDDNIYKYGSEFNSFDTVKRITSEELDSRYFINYVKDKFYPLYDM